MIKLLIFDLDGVIIESREIHYISLNIALGEINTKYIIHRDEHLSKYNGLPTKDKLAILTKEKGLPSSLHNTVWQRKQFHTYEAIKKVIHPEERLKILFSRLKEDGYIIYCASNSIWNTIKQILVQLEIIEYFDYFISNEEVKNAKPSSEIYLKCFQRANVATNEVLIFEDSHVGRKAALSSGAYLCPITDPSDLTLSKVMAYVNMANQASSQFDLRWKGKLNVVIPMAGHGSRFSKVGYALPKPLIDVFGEPMIKRVINNLNVDAHFIFIVQQSHLEKYGLEDILKSSVQNCTIIPIDHVTEGAACTVLLAKEFINNDTSLLIANSDQYLEWDSNVFLYASSETDGCISTFRSNEPKWSFAKLGEDGWVKEVREKVPISDIATTGIYFWKKGSDFVSCAEKMIEKNIRVNDEFYVCPVYNEAIAQGLKIRTINCQKMWGIGTPEDLEFFLKNYKFEH